MAKSPSVTAGGDKRGSGRENGRRRVRWGAWRVKVMGASAAGARGRTGRVPGVRWGGLGWGEPSVITEIERVKNTKGEEETFREEMCNY